MANGEYQPNEVGRPPKQVTVRENTTTESVRENIRDPAVGGPVSSSLVEVVGGIGAVVLSILGLVGLLPLTFAAIATIAIGAALLMEGGAIGSRVYTTASRQGMSDVPSDMVGGLGAESIAGIAALALGVLALIGLDSFILLEVAMIVIGAGLLFGSAATWRINYSRFGGYERSDTAGYVARQSVTAASGAHALVGIGVIVLGILALLGNSPLLLVLISALAVGGVVLLSGAAIGGRFALLHR